MEFKTRVCESIIIGASIYKAVLLEYEYLLYSPEFIENQFYIISANKDNYKHLTGVHSPLSAKEFYAKCCDGTITEQDFDFVKSNKSEKSTKGSVREKILALPSLSNLFVGELFAEENFSKGRVYCNLGTADGNLTLGFVKTATTVPLTLLRKNHLNMSKAVAVPIILRRNKGRTAYDVLLKGNTENLLEMINMLLNIKEQQ